MNREELFKELLTSLKENKSAGNDEYKYIGTGNPFANILIIGKEAAISKEKDSMQYQKEIVENFNFWCSNRKYEISNIKEKDFVNYNPLYPYRGQDLKLDNKKNNCGTSRTWMAYQKLYNYLFDTKGNTKINFHEKFFLTEVNSTPSPKTANANRNSIPFRKENIFSSKYFQSFPIVIIAGVGYFKTIKKNDEKNEIEKMFNVNYLPEENLNFNAKQPYWIHMNEEKSKIVINTYQLSMNISDKLLEDIAKTIKSNKLFKSLYPDIIRE